jgi:hypothetical protein
MTVSGPHKRGIAIPTEDPQSGSSLLPMLISGIVLIVAGMIAVVILT